MTRVGSEIAEFSSKVSEVVLVCALRCREAFLHGKVALTYVHEIKE